MANAVTFDVDSTVITEEAIDELANFCGKGEEITELFVSSFGSWFDFDQCNSTSFINMKILKHIFQNKAGYARWHDIWTILIYKTWDHKSKFDTSERIFEYAPNAHKTYYWHQVRYSFFTIYELMWICVIFLRIVKMYFRELVSTLQARGKQVFLVSGGFRCFITPIAIQLNIPSENIYANRLKFYYTGKYYTGKYMQYL